MPHELRQPLNAIRCYAYSLLKQTMKAGSNLDKEKFASGLEEINEQAQRADEIIQKVRDYVKDKSRDLTQVDLDKRLRASHLATLTAKFKCKRSPRKFWAIHWKLN